MGVIDVRIKDDESKESAKVTNGGLDINIQDQHTRILDLKFLNANPANFTTLTADADIGDTVIAVTQVTGMTTGMTIGLTNPSGIFYFGEVVSVDTLNVTLDTPIDNIFPSADSNVIVADSHLNKEGTLAEPVIFQIAGVGAGTGIEIDITRIMGNISDGTAMDDGKFGGLDKLDNGCTLRHVNGTIQNLWNVKSNGDIALICFDAQYTDKAPSGENGYRFRNTFAGQDKHGVTIRLEAGDTLELLVQDDLSDLTDFQMMAQGHVVE